jgi:hypothetical protein
MAAGDPVLINLTGATFLLSAETGGIIQSESSDVDSSVKTVFDASKGYDVGEVYYNFKRSISWSVIINGTTGLPIAAPGVAITLANDLSVGTAKNGVATGGIYTRTINITQAGEELRMASGTAIQRAGIS